jgi:hypothetical protein
MQMKPGDLIKEALFPLTDMTVLMAIIGFGVLVWLASAAGILGLWLAFIVVPAIFRYALYLLEARAHGKATLVAEINIFNIADNFWGLFPLLFFCSFVWLEIYIIDSFSMQAAQILLVIFLLIYPSSLAVLGVTRSPLESMNPVMMFRMIKSCGVNYVWIPIVLAFVTFAAWALSSSVLPEFLDYFLQLYVFFLLFTFTGAVVHSSGIVAKVDIEAPLARTEWEVAGDLDKERQKVANHAYGFISRGNREGGFRHIRQWIESEPDADAAVGWFFNEMLKWDSKDAALIFGQQCLSHYLHHDLDTPALKLMSRCLYEDPRWKPASEDRQHAIELADRHNRDDIGRLLRS